MKEIANFQIQEIDNGYLVIWMEGMLNQFKHGVACVDIEDVTDVIERELNARVGVTPTREETP